MGIDGSIEMEEYPDTCRTCGETGNICDCDGYWTNYDSRMPKVSKGEFLRTFIVGCLLAVAVFVLMNDIFSHAAGR